MLVDSLSDSHLATTLQVMIVYRANELITRDRAQTNSKQTSGGKDGTVVGPSTEYWRLLAPPTRSDGEYKHTCPHLSLLTSMALIFGLLPLISQ